VTAPVPSTTRPPKPGRAGATTLVLTAVVALGVAALYAAWPRLMRPSTHGQMAVTPNLLVEFVCAAVAAGALAVGARRLRGHERRAWQLMGAGVACWAAGSLAWALYATAGRVPPFPGPVDVLYLLMVPLVAAGIVVHPTPRRRERAVRSIVDGLLVATALLLIIWVLALRVAFAPGLATRPLEATVNLAYPIGDTLLIVMLLALVLRTGDHARRPLVMFAVGLTVVAISDLVFFVLSSVGSWETSPHVVNAGWSVGFVIVAGAGLMLSVPVAAPPRATSPRHESALALVPTALGAIALCVGVVDLSLGLSDIRLTIPLMTAVAGLLLLRQALSVAQGRRLAGRLAASVEQLAEEAHHDRLTGLYNRSGLARRLVQGRGQHGGVVGVLFVDIDHLKSVNDSLGHEVGDQLICSMARRLTDQLGAEAVSRFGGDEFVALVPGPTLADVTATASDIITVGSLPVSAGDVPLVPSLSAGLAVWEAGLAVDEVLRRADTALYRAKSRGRHRVVVYDPSMDAASRRRMALEPEIRRAVEQGELVVHYQPVYALESGRLLGAEALVRWNHPDRGLLPPDEFIGDAEGTGLMEQIGGQVLEVATTDFAALNRQGARAPLRVSVNMSTSELASPEATKHVHDALSRSGLDPADLTIEITEDVVVDDTTRRTIDQLMELGVGIAIDDFGTGNSSLRQLGSYPASQLKIDRDFVSGLGRDPEDTFVVRAIINLARSLGMSTVAEGVETGEQAGILRKLGCDAGQGWFYDRARPLTELRDRHLTGTASGGQ